MLCLKRHSLRPIAVLCVLFDPAMWVAQDPKLHCTALSTCLLLDVAESARTTAHLGVMQCSFQAAASVPLLSFKRRHTSLEPSDAPINEMSRDIIPLLEIPPCHFRAKAHRAYILRGDGQYIPVLQCSQKIVHVGHCHCSHGGSI